MIADLAVSPRNTTRLASHDSPVPVSTVMEIKQVHGENVATSASSKVISQDQEVREPDDSITSSDELMSPHNESSVGSSRQNTLVGITSSSINPESSRDPLERWPFSKSKPINGMLSGSSAVVVVITKDREAVTSKVTRTCGTLMSYGPNHHVMNPVPR